MTAVEMIALRCTPQGAVTTVLVDNVGLGDPRLIADVVAAGSLPDALTLVREVAHEVVTAPIQVGIASDGGAHTLWCVGAAESGDVVLVGAPHVTALDAAVAAIASKVEPATLHLLRDRVAAAPMLTDEDDVLLELSRTNNDLIRLHRELASAKARVDGLNTRKDQILAMVAHDLRNPLGSMGGFARSLQRMLGGDLDPPAARMLERIVTLSDQMIDMVDDLLDARSLEQGQLTLELAPVDISDLVDRTVDMYAAASSHKGQSFVVSCDCDDTHVNGDERRLLQVFDNLVSNAVKYSPADADATITVECTCTTESVAVTIRDEGAGMAVDEHDLVFEPFARTSTQPTGGERSTGLGLPISRSIVEAHGGALTFESAPGEGSTFTVVLPRMPPSRPQPQGH